MRKRTPISRAEGSPTPDSAAFFAARPTRPLKDRPHCCDPVRPRGHQERSRPFRMQSLAKRPSTGPMEFPLRQSPTLRQRRWRSCRRMASSPFATVLPWKPSSYRSRLFRREIIPWRDRATAFRSASVRRAGEGGSSDFELPARLREKPGRPRLRRWRRLVGVGLNSRLPFSGVISRPRGRPRCCQDARRRRLHLKTLVFGSSVSTEPLQVLPIAGAKFCTECGTRFRKATAKFWSECGAPRGHVVPRETARVLPIEERVNLCQLIAHAYRAAMARMRPACGRAPRRGRSPIFDSCRPFRRGRC